MFNLSLQKDDRRRRRSFDNQAWQSISQLRTATSKVAREAALERTRAGLFPTTDNDVGEGKERRSRTRRWTVSDESEEPLSGKELAKRYGNMALEFDMIQQEMQLLQKEQLDYYRDVVGCEMATIQFLSTVDLFPSRSKLSNVSSIFVSFEHIVYNSEN